MRGDSLQDLYAKALALLGLGVLAGTGALVDYWPVGIHMPVAASALTQPSAPQALSLPDLVSPARTSNRTLGGRLMLARYDAVRALPVEVSSDAEVGQPLSLVDPIAHVATAESRADDVELRSVFATPDLTSLTDENLEAMASAPVAAAAEEAASDGFFTGAFKKTGTSIVRSGVKTGTSIVDAMRVVGEAVRRALPN